MTEEQTDSLQLSLIIYTFTPTYVRGVITRALQYRGEASESARDAFNSAMTASIRMDRFRDASKAPVNQLTEYVLEDLVRQNDRLAGGLMRTWTESQEELRALVAAHLEESGVELDGPDYRERVFRSLWDKADWLRQIEAITSGRDDLEDDDVGLMLCLVSGRAPKAPGGEAAIESEFLTDFLDGLWELAPDADEWKDIEAFVQAVNEMADLRSAERRLAAAKELKDVLDAMDADYDPELKYLDIDLAAWDEQVASRPDLMEDALDLAKELADTLGRYRPVRPQAESREEETARAAERTDLEAEILRIVNEWPELMSRPPVEVDTPSAKAAAVAVGDAASDDEEEEAEPAVSVEEHQAALAEIERLVERGEALKAQNDKLAGAGDALRAENEKLSQANVGLQADKQAIDDEFDAIKVELAQSRKMEETWRMSYVSAMAEAGGASGEAQADPENVGEAIALAEQSFAGNLVVALNSKSDKNSQYQKPREVFDVLAWLATDYHARRTGPGGTSDFDKLLKEACSGWSYKAGQTEVTREQFAPWYTTQHGGKQYDLSHHLAKGNSRDPRNTMRIGFAWDDESRQVIVGYIGLHQRNRRT